MALDTQLRAVALRLLKAQGALVTITKTGVVQDAAQPWNKTSSAETTQTAYAVISSYNTFEQATIEGIQENDMRFFMEADSITTSPVVGDQIVDGTDKYNIIEVLQIAHVPGGVVIAYDCRVRR